MIILIIIILTIVCVLYICVKNRIVVFTNTSYSAKDADKINWRVPVSCTFTGKLSLNFQYTPVAYDSFVVIVKYEITEYPLVYCLFLT